MTLDEPLETLVIKYGSVSGISTPSFDPSTGILMIKTPRKDSEFPDSKTAARHHTRRSLCSVPCNVFSLNNYACEKDPG